MKFLIAVLVLPLVVLAAMAVAVYEAIASIPSWLLVLAIGYLLYRQCRRPRHPHTGYQDTARYPGPPVHQTWAAPMSAPQPPPMVAYLVVPDRRGLPDPTQAPQRWSLH